MVSGLQQDHGRDDAVSKSEERQVYENGRLRIDFDAYEVFVEGEEVRVYLREFELLRYFVRHPNRVFNREQLLQSVWANSGHTDSRTVDVHIRRLRMHIERDDAHPEIIVTVRGVGYKFVDRALSEAPRRGARRVTSAKRVTKL